MMHRNDFVVSIRPAGGGKTYREYKIDKTPDSSDTRSRQINIPFDQEYEFVFKNMKAVRRSITLEIDGNEIGSWVVGKGDRKFPNEVVLERFMDSDKRFKVLHLGDGGVDDPSNPENGVIKIKVIDEQPSISMRWIRSHDGEQYSNGGITRGMRGCSGGDMKGMSAAASYSCDLNVAPSGGEVNLSAHTANAATGEGSHSGQQFTSTTWHGDNGTPIFFVFYIHGVDRPVQMRSAVLFCHECGSEVVNCAKFCHHCGTKVAVTV